MAKTEKLIYLSCSDIKKKFLFEEISCDFCGKNQYQKIFSLKDTLTEYDENINIVKCLYCSLVYINPRPAESSLSSFYPANFLSYQFVKAESVNFWNFRSRAVNFIIDNISKQRISFLKKKLDLTKNLKLSDFGCGKGFFLKRLKSISNFTVSGFDFDKETVDYCTEQGLNVRQQTVNSINSTASFDIVTMWHFLEHTLSPLEAIRKVRDVLAPNGIVIIIVPNWNSLENKLFGKNSFLLDPPRHLYQFSEQTLCSALVREGFEIKHSDCCSGEGGWLGSIEWTFFKGKLFRNFRKSVFSIILLSVLVLPIDILTSWTKRGSILRIVAKKKLEPGISSNKVE